MPNRNPAVTGSLRPAGVTVGLAEERALFVGQQNGGTATSGALTTNILNDNSWDTLYGADSPLAAAIRRARRRNGETRFDAIGLDDNGSGVAAAGTFTITGPATEAGAITFYIGSKKFNAYEVAVADTDTPTIIGDALVSAIAADSNALVTAGNAAGTVTLTAKSAGTFGNTLGLEISGSVAGVGVTLGAMSGGAVDPVLTGVFDVVGNQRYQGIIWQFPALDEVKDFLDGRFNVQNDILDGRAFFGATDTLANHLTVLGLLNSNSIVYNTDKLISKATKIGPNVLEVPFVKQAEFGAVRALRRTDDAILGSNVIARSAGDAFGGPELNSKPYFNTPLPDCLVPDVGDSWSETEIRQLEDAGGWVIDANVAFNTVISGAVTTTHKTDVAGNPDITWKFLNYVDTSTAAREYIVNNTRAQYPQYRATGGALIPGVDSANEASVAAFVIEKIQELGDLALLNQGVGTIDGEQVDYDRLHREGLTVTLNPATGAFAVSAKLYIVTQLRDVLYDFAIAFEV